MPFASSVMLAVMGTQLGAQLVGPGWMLLGDLYLKKKWREKTLGLGGFVCTHFAENEHKCGEK